MFSNKWSAIKQRNKGKALALKVENKHYIDSVIGYCNSQGTGLLECEIIKRDLIGMAQEAEKAEVFLEDRLGDVEEFGKGLSAEGQKIFSKERWYYFLWQYGLGAAIMSGAQLFITGRYERATTIEYVTWFLVYAFAIVFYDMFFRMRFALKKGMKRYTAFAIHFTFVFCFTYYMMEASTVGHRLPEATYWLILLIGIIMYISGRILFFRNMKQMAEEYGWDLDSLV